MLDSADVTWIVAPIPELASIMLMVGLMMLIGLAGLGREK